MTKNVNQHEEITWGKEKKRGEGGDVISVQETKTYILLNKQLLLMQK